MSLDMTLKVSQGFGRMIHTRATPNPQPTSQPSGSARGTNGHEAPMWPLAIHQRWWGLMPLPGITFEPCPGVCTFFVNHGFKLKTRKPLSLATWLAKPSRVPCWMVAGGAISQPSGALDRPFRGLMAGESHRAHQLVQAGQLARRANGPVWPPFHKHPYVRKVHGSCALRYHSAFQHRYIIITYKHISQPSIVKKFEPSIILWPIHLYSLGLQKFGTGLLKLTLILNQKI